MAATIHVHSNAAEVGLWFQRKAGEVEIFGAAASSVLAKASNDILTPLIQEEAPVGKTGMLAAGIRASTRIVPGGAELTWSDDVPYADFVIHGTGIYHTPTPHAPWDVEGLQAFEVNGDMIFALHTHHEGQQPNDYPARALERAQPLLDAALFALGDKLFAVFV